jgi:hypothetical protein
MVVSGKKGKITKKTDEELIFVFTVRKEEGSFLSTVF